MMNIINDGYSINSTPVESFKPWRGRLVSCEEDTRGFFSKAIAKLRAFFTSCTSIEEEVEKTPSYCRLDFVAFPSNSLLLQLGQKEFATE